MDERRIKYPTPASYTKPIKATSDVNGYRTFWDPEHPLAWQSSGSVYHHRHVASVKEGRWLNANEFVHHKDERRDNNDPENLEVTNSKRHMVQHASPQEAVTCLNCQKQFVWFAAPSRVSSGRAPKFCSSACAHANSERFSIDPKTLRVLVWQKPVSQIAREYGVSDVAVAKRCKKFGIERPGRGYWAKQAAGS